MPFMVWLTVMILRRVTPFTVSDTITCPLRGAPGLVEAVTVTDADPDEGTEPRVSQSTSVDTSYEVDIEVIIFNVVLSPAPDNEADAGYIEKFGALSYGVPLR